MSNVNAPGWPPPGWREQGQVLGEGWTPEQRRVTAKQVAEAMVGMTARDPRYIAALYPWDASAVALGMAKGQHKCALTAMAIVRALGFIDAHDGKRYADRFAVKPTGPVPPDAMTQLQELPAFARGDLLPLEGEIPIIYRQGDPTATHTICCVGYEDDGKTLVSVDGHYGHEPVDVRRRRVVRIGEQIWLEDAVMGKRRVLGVVRTGELAVSREWVAPG